MNKLAIINSPIYPMITSLVNLFGLRTKGMGGGKCFGNRILFRSTRINCSGTGNKIEIGDHCRFRNVLVEIEGNNNTIHIGAGVMVYEHCYISIKGDDCNIYIDDKTTIGGASLFAEESNTSIRIGKDCMLGRKISVSTTDFHSIIDMATGKRINPAKNVTIGNHVWIGADVAINKGAFVADNSIVGSNSVVTKQFEESNIILIGMPAKKIREAVTWSRQKL